MKKEKLSEILKKVAAGQMSPEDAEKELESASVADLGFARLDMDRELRTGYPEAVFCQGKTDEQIAEIVALLAEKNGNVIATRATKENFEAVRAKVEDARYLEDARLILVERNPLEKAEKTVAVVSAGTADIPVAEEAACVAEMMGNRVERFYDVGVAGIHRLLSCIEDIRKAGAVIVVAGMEGALASVVGGLVERPVIAVPTSVGYGANLGGLSALLSMLNSCANGVGIVNIDNGFGAGYLAAQINRSDF